MKIATWNVNSLKIRLPHVIGWLQQTATDVLCLQELKLDDPAFPHAELAAIGYDAVWHGQKTYNGVAILTRQATIPRVSDVTRNIPGFADPQSRLISASLGEGDDALRVVCGYFPNGQAVGSDKFAYKMEWLQALTNWLTDELTRHPRLVLAGDFNIAPSAADAHPDWQEEIHVSAPERAAFARLLDLGLIDAFRLFPQGERSFSWWDYRAMAFRRNFGLRIDHVLVSTALHAHVGACQIDKGPRRLERPSDHTPVVLDLPSVV